MSETILDLGTFFGVAPLDEPTPSLPVFPNNIHICHFYKKKKDLLELLVAFFLDGLRRGEFCLWGVAEPLLPEEAMHVLDKAAGGISPYFQKGQLEIFDISQLYGTNHFDAVAVRDAFLAKVGESLKQGWRGFRCDGMASGLAPRAWKNFQIYEAEITRHLPSSITALCSYDLTTLSAENVIEVVSAHQASLVKKSNDWRVIESIEYMLSKENQGNGSIRK